MSRRTYTVETPEALTLLVVRLCQESGAASWELKYDAADRQLADGEEPGPDELVRWTATVGYKRRGKIPAREIVGTATARGDEGAKGGMLALLDLVERMGGNVVLLDYTNRTDPRADDLPRPPA